MISAVAYKSHTLVDGMVGASLKLLYNGLGN